MSIYEELRALDDRDEPRTLRFASTGLRLWPYVRWIALSAAADQVLGLTPAFGSRGSPSLRNRVELVARAALRGPLRVRRPFDIVIVNSSAGLIERDGRWFDRINDYFALEQAERTLVLDKSLDGTYKTPRVPPHVRAFDTFDFLASARARFRRPVAGDLASIDKLVAFVRDRFPVKLTDGALSLVRDELVHWSLRLPALHGYFLRFFERVRPQLLCVENGSYGPLSHVNTWARAAGAETAEFQHGVISRAHLAYNYGDGVLADASLASELPQHLLLYGDFWQHEVRTHSEPVVIGCPHFTEARPTRTGGTTVLTISQGICTEQMVRITGALARACPDQRFVFRLHPGEVAFRERYAQLAEISNIEIDDRGDLYARFAEARLVIGHSSTALVEAAGVGLPVCIVDDEQSRAIMPADLGTWCRDVDAIRPMIETPPPPSTDPARYFAPDWRERYRAFVTSRVRRG